VNAATHAIPVLNGPLDATVRPPGSKSETIRALAAASLADGKSHLYTPLVAEDPHAIAGALRDMGVGIDDTGDPWSVDGVAGRLTSPVGDLDVNESGLSARILLAMAGSLDGFTRIVGKGRLPERPMNGIVEVLRSQGVEVSGDHLPIEVHSRGPLWGGRLEVDCSQSSQFASAVMLVAPIMHEAATIELKGLAGSRGYLDMTESIMRRFGADVRSTVTGYEIANAGYTAADVVIEPDASAAVYPMGVAAVSGGRVVIDGLGSASPQPDLLVATALESMGCRVEWEPHRVTVDAGDIELRAIEIDMSAAPDGALALAAVCMFADGPSRISGLGSLRHKESDRLTAISEEIRRVGGGAEVDGDTLVLRPDRLKGAAIDPHGDHRIAMAMAIVGTVVDETSVNSPSVVNKTWPEFWRVLDDLAER
jgi:3-phosphoshikimate 1-carboxyvinyltransferase